MLQNCHSNWPVLGAYLLQVSLDWGQGIPILLHHHTIVTVAGTPELLPVMLTLPPAACMWCVLQVESERVAWQLATELGLDLVTILPNFVLGPVFADNMMSISIGFMKVSLAGLWKSTSFTMKGLSMCG